MVLLAQLRYTFRIYFVLHDNRIAYLHLSNMIINIFEKISMSQNEIPGNANIQIL